MGRKRKIFRRAVDLTKKLLRYEIKQLGPKHGVRISSELVEEFTPIEIQETECGEIRFFCPGTFPLRRARSLLTKEPMTIEWIKTFDDHDIFWDIGANIGVFTLFAANRGLKVLSFEPSPNNFYLLSKNIEINCFDEKVSAFCFAFNDHSIIDYLFMQNSELAGSLSSFAEAIDTQGMRFSPAFKKAMLGFSVDDFIDRFDPLFPNHIKIDVDGIEDKIVDGAIETLKNRRMKSLLIELDPQRETYFQGVKRKIEKAGYVYHKRAPMKPSKQRKKVSVGNHIFIRS